MKQIKNIMGMPITVEVVDGKVTKNDLKKVFDYFKYMDKKFSTYRKDSEISLINNSNFPATSRLKKNSEIALINQGKIPKHKYSPEMRTVFRLSEKTKKETNGFFDIYHNGRYDPSGLVKGWAILNAGKILESLGFKNFYIEAGGDIQVKGKNSQKKIWKIGIKNPFNQKQIVKVVEASNIGIATSGTYFRGQHIYSPIAKQIDDIVSLTVIGPNIYEADRFATAAFAMGKPGIEFIEKLPGFEAYLIDTNGIATYTSGFEIYTLK